MRSPRVTSLFPIAPALLGVLTISLLAGCGGGGGGNGNSNPGTTTTTGTTGANTGNNSSSSATSLSVTTTNGLVATLSEPSKLVGVGGTVVYTVSITNPTAAGVTIQSASQSAPTTPAASLVVRDAAGNKVYDPLPGGPPVFTATLAPGQTLSTTVTVNAYAARGVYNASVNFGETNPATPVGPLSVTAQ